MFGMQYSISVENQPYPVLCTLSPNGCTAHVPDFPKVTAQAPTLDAALLEVKQQIQKALRQYKNPPIPTKQEQIVVPQNSVLVLVKASWQHWPFLYWPVNSAKFIHKKRPGGWKFQPSGRSRFAVLGSFWGQSYQIVTIFAIKQKKARWNLSFQRAFVVWVWQKRYPAVYLFFYRKPLRLFFDYSCSISAFAINWDVSNSLYQYILLIEHANARVRLRVLFFG